MLCAALRSIRLEKARPARNALLRGRSGGGAGWRVVPPRRGPAGGTARQGAPGPGRLRRGPFLASRGYSARRAVRLAKAAVPPAAASAGRAEAATESAPHCRFRAGRAFFSPAGARFCQRLLGAGALGRTRSRVALPLRRRRRDGGAPPPSSR